MQQYQLGYIANLPHAVVEVTGTPSLGFTYDANGSMTTRKVGANTFTLFYDAELHLTEVKENGATVASFAVTKPSTPLPSGNTIFNSQEVNNMCPIVEPNQQTAKIYPSTKSDDLIFTHSGKQNILLEMANILMVG
ncbi:MAG: hypothetical protein NC238_13540 [Dehalobacter sp.]|nr:hypothetical protein [Dehalobacter sp.]